VARYLDEIVAHHRARAAADDATVGELLAVAERAEAAPSLASALRRDPGVSLVAECKRRSPSQGWFVAPDHDVVAQARAYERGGAQAISVLTDERYFGGSLNDLRAVRGAVSVPLLRKDFIVDVREVLRARSAGASAILLIAAALEPSEYEQLARAAHDVGLEVVLEVHEARELTTHDPGLAHVVGVNQRDLGTFAVDTERAQRTQAALPEEVVRLAESGVRSPGDLAQLVGFDAVLVGEWLMRAEEPERAVRALVEQGERVHQDLRHHQSA